MNAIQRRANRPAKPFTPPPSNTLHIEMAANGVGDATLGLFAVAGAKAKYPFLKIVYHTRQPQWVSLFDGYDELADVGTERNAKQLNSGYASSLVTKGELPSWKRYCNNINVEAIQPELRDRDTLIKEGAAYAGVIALCVKACYQNRNWSMDRWQALEGLLMERGERVVIIHNRPMDLAGFKGECLWNRNAREIVSVMLNARRIIGVESGMVSTASTLNLKPVVLCGPSLASKWYRNPVIEVTGAGGVVPGCAGCFWQRPFQSSCDSACQSLLSISPEQVMQFV